MEKVKKKKEAARVKKSVAATYRIDEGVLSSLSEYSSATRRCKSTIVELAIEEYIRRHSEDEVNL